MYLKTCNGCTNGIEHNGISCETTLLIFIHVDKLNTLGEVPRPSPLWLNVRMKE